MPVQDSVQLSKFQTDSLSHETTSSNIPGSHSSFKKISIDSMYDSLSGTSGPKKVIIFKIDTGKHTLSGKSSKIIDEQEIPVNKTKAEVQDSSKNNENVIIAPFFESKYTQFQYAPLPIWQDIKTCTATEQKLSFHPYISQQSQLNWTLLIFFVSIALILGVNSYYRKFINQVITTLVNFQLADKLLREKNVIVRRAFLMMNLNFLLVFSLFIMLLMKIFEIRFTEKQFLNFLLILGIVMSILLVRLFLFYTVAFIFNWIPAVNKQIHSIYLINKNIGLLLLPLVFTAIYTTPIVSRIIIFTGLGLILLAFLYKLVRGFQIIIKNGILLFYAILYLCTLELLPWVLSSKLFIYLR
jgi:hypothetical protein